MEDKDPFSSFDWYFTDASAEDGARRRALNDRPQQTLALMHVVSANSLMHFALWSELPAGHPVAELWLETQTDLLATIYLAYGGFFRQALTILRSWFEIAVHGVFFSEHYGQPNDRYEQWRRGRRNAPAKMLDLARSLASRADKAVNVEESAILDKLGPVYEFLSLQTHAQGLDIYDLQKGRDNVPRYLPESFDLWLAKVLEAFNAICFLYRLFFPKEIAAYLKGSRAELERMVELTRVLRSPIPEFGTLVDDVLVLVARSG